MSGPSSAPGKFCALAWVHRFTNIAGQIQVCCSSEEYDNNVRDSAGQRMNIRDQLSDEQILNSEFMKNVRVQLLKGEFPELCRRCQITEETGGVSRRMNENQHFAPMIADLVRGTSADGEIAVAVKSADYRLGNLCNLACRMCSPHASTPWAKYSRPMANPDGTVRFDHLSFDVEKQDWYEAPGFLDYFKAQVQQLEHLHFAGGEPLINPKMEALLRHCVELNAAKNIMLTYNTNLTRVPDAVKALWPHFRGVEIYASVDAYGALNEFIRHPTRWNDIDKNLRDLDENFDRYGLRSVEVMTTAQLYNIFQLEDLYDYLFENMTRVNKLPKLVDLHVPTFLRSQVLPQELKSLATKRLEAVLEKSQQRMAAGLIARREAWALETISGAINFLHLEDRSHEMSDFLTFNKMLDQLHKKNTMDVLPELRAWLAQKEISELKSQGPSLQL